MRDILIGIDAGTSVMKSVAFDTSGRQIASAALPNRYETFAGGGAEQDMARTWADCAATLQQLAEKVPDLASRTIALAVTAQGDGTWLIDRDGEPVGRAWLWLDARAAGIVEAVAASGGDALRFERTGTGLAACHQGPQLARMRREHPERLARAATAFHCKDWLHFKLTGVRATDPSEACFTFGNFRTRDYDEEVIRVLGLSGERRLLPPIVDGAAAHHPLSDEAARATSLLPGTPVVLASVDIVCTGLGAGLFDRAARPGCTIVGSTGMHMRLSPGTDVALNRNRTGYTMCLPAPGVFAQVQSNMAATLNIDWVLGLAADLLRSQGVPRTAPEMLASVDNWLAASQPGSLLYQPYVSEAGERGPFIDASARAGFVGLSSRHTFADLARAVFEGLAYASRDCYEAMGDRPTEVRLTGGAARSAALRRILAAVLNASVRTSSREEAGAAGAAMIAALSVGLYPDMEACAAAWVTPLLGEADRPDEDLAAVYDKGFAVFQDAHEALRPIWRKMAAGRSGAGA